MTKQQFLEQLELEFNGCPWLNEESPLHRERGDLDELAGRVVVVEDVYAIKDYHAVIFYNDPKVYLSGGGLKQLLSKYASSQATYIRQLKIRIGEKRGFKEGDERKEYRPITIMGYLEEGETV